MASITVVAFALLAIGQSRRHRAAAAVTQPVKRFRRRESMRRARPNGRAIRSLQQASGDVASCAIVKTFRPTPTSGNSRSGCFRWRRDRSARTERAARPPGRRRSAGLDRSRDDLEHSSRGLPAKPVAVHGARVSTRDVRRRPPGGGVAHHRPDRERRNVTLQGFGVIRQRVHPTRAPGADCCLRCSSCSS